MSDDGQVENLRNQALPDPANQGLAMAGILASLREELDALKFRLPKKRPYPGVALAEITDLDTTTGLAAWKEKYVDDDGTIVDRVGGRVETDKTAAYAAVLVPSADGVQVGDVGLLLAHDVAGSTRYAILLSTGGGALIPVSLTLDTASDGTTTSAPANTYKWPVNVVTGVEIKMADRTTRATGLSPTWARAGFGSYNTATHGTVYIDSSGDPVLWDCDESEKNCT